MKRLICVLILLSAIFLREAAHLRADDAPEATEKKEPQSTRLTLHPSKLPTVSLKYQLLPPLLDRKPGNAAVLYNKILIEAANKSIRDSQDKFSDWLDLPAPQLPLDEIRKSLAKWANQFADLHTAARREQCDWQLLIHERNYIKLNLEEIQELRAIARLLAVQARLQVAEGKYDEAIETIQTGFALSRQIAKGPTLINSIVGFTTFDVMSKPLGDWLERPNSPNLYWALTMLPRPFLELRPGLEGEISLMYLTYPELLPNERERLKPELFDGIVNRLLKDFSEEGMTTDKWITWDKAELATRLTPTYLATTGYPIARARMIERGRTAEELDKMRPLQVVAIDAMEVYDELKDRTVCCCYLPYWQAAPLLEAEEKYLATEAHKREVLPLATLLVVPMRTICFFQAKADRTIAANRLVEAIRLYATMHEGKLPATLSEINVVPIPIDPSTGKDFQYKLDGDNALLWSEEKGPRNSPDDNMMFEMRISK